MNTTIDRSESKIVVTCGNNKATVYANRSGARAIWSLKWTDPTGKRKSSTFTSEAAAVKAAEWSVTNPVEKAVAVTKNRNSAVTLADVLRLLAANGKGPLVEEPKAEALTPNKDSFAKTISAFKSSLQERQCSDRYVATVGYHLDRFDRFVGKPLREITAADVTAFLLTIPHPKTRKNIRGTLVTLGEFAKKRGWMPWAAPTPFEMTDCPVVKTAEHDILSPEDIKKLLDTTAKRRPALVPWMALGAFAGIRAAERVRLTWDDIDFDHKVITLGTKVTKTARRRVIEMPDNLVEWLKAYRQYPLAPEGTEARLYEIVRDIADKAGIRWVPNGLRASAASYHLMKYENAPKTSLQMGHSVRELETVYFRPSLRGTADAWYAVLPDQTLPAPTQ